MSILSEIEAGQEDWAFTIGVQAYIWGFPVVECWKDRLRKLDLQERETAERGARLNAFKHVRLLSAPESSEFVNAATDFLYSTAVIDLRDGPLLLTAPPFSGRWYVVQVLDPYMETVVNLGTRTQGDQLPPVVLSAADVSDVPVGAQVIHSDSSHLYVVARIAVDPAEDLREVHSLQDGLRLAPLYNAKRAGQGTGALERAGAAPTDPTYDPLWVPRTGDSDDLAFFFELGSVLRRVPPKPHEAMLTALLTEIGIDLREGFNRDAIPEGVRRGLARAVPFAESILRRKLYEVGTDINGWGVVRNIGRYGTNYVIRALVAKHGIWANVPEESMYFIARTDRHGHRLHGANRYEVRFPPGAAPPVNAFWSISYYDEHGRLVANPIRRYSVSSLGRTLKCDPDGSISIIISRDDPGRSATENWLPSHDGPFFLTLRCYNPRPELLTLKYSVPPVVRLDA